MADDGGDEGHVPDWNNQPFHRLIGPALAWSTVVEADGRAKNNQQKACAFCGKLYSGGPALIEQHMDAIFRSKLSHSLVSFVFFIMFNLSHKVTPSGGGSATLLPLLNSHYLRYPIRRENNINK